MIASNDFGISVGWTSFASTIVVTGLEQHMKKRSEVDLPWYQWDISRSLNWIIILQLPSGNQTWQWNIPYKWWFQSENHLNKWSIFQHTMFDSRRVNPSTHNVSWHSHHQSWTRFRFLDSQQVVTKRPLRTRLALSMGLTSPRALSSGKLTQLRKVTIFYG